VIGIFSQLASNAKQRRLEANPAGYYIDAGIVRMFWAIVTLAIGTAFPPLWALTIVLAISGIYCFSIAKSK
jgi:hypothetical protein